MAMRPGPRSGSSASDDLAAAVVGAVAHLDSSGGTADEIAQSLNASLDGVGLQADLEMLVRQGILDRRGIGRGALYSLARRGRVYSRAHRIRHASRVDNHNHDVLGPGQLIQSL